MGAVQAAELERREMKSMKALESSRQDSVLSILYKNKITKIVTYFNLASML